MRIYDNIDAHLSKQSLDSGRTELGTIMLSSLCDKS